LNTPVFERPKKENRNCTKTILVVQFNKVLEGKLFLIIHSDSLKISFFDESQLPTLEGGSGSIKDPVILLFPNQPCSNYKNIHEKFIVKLNTGLLHH
jgi:hypothetical protein